MAFTKTPETQTYSSERLPACYTIDRRGGLLYTQKDVDAGMVNLVPRKYKGSDGTETLEAETRLPLYGASVLISGAANTYVRGMYVWEKSVGTTYYFMVIGVGVYTSTTGAGGSWTLVTSFVTPGITTVGFTEFIDSTNTKKLVIVDGIEGYVFTSNAAGTKIVDADFPTPHIPYPVFIDGYLFLAKAGTGDIYNSDLNDPALWTAGNFISSELYPDDIQALIKVNNYLLAIGTLGCEYFYDAANATGTPLARYEGGSLPFGTSLPDSIANNKNTVVMLANNNDGEACLKIIEDFKHKELRPEWLISYIENAFLNFGSASIRGYFYRQAGSLYYCLRLPGVNVSTSDTTWVYSLDTGIWTEFKLDSATSDFPVTRTSFSTSNNVLTFIAGKKGSNFFFGTVGSSTLGVTSAGTDFVVGSSNIYTEIRTATENFGTLNNKTMSRFGVFATLSGGSGVATANIDVTWADKDYNWGSGGTGTINITASNQFPFITQLGQFRQRAFRLVYQGIYSIRYKFLEMDINKGQQ